MQLVEGGRPETIWIPTRAFICKNAR